MRMEGILIAVFLMFLLLGCREEFVNKDPSDQIAQHFDGYNWSWFCGDHEYNFTLWKQNIKAVYPSAGLWIVEGTSSSRTAPRYEPSSDESAQVVIVYRLENDAVVNRIHGKQIPPLLTVLPNGTIENRQAVRYC